MPKRPPFVAAGPAELESRRLMSGPGTTSPAVLADIAKVVGDENQMLAVHAAGDAAVQADLAAFEKALAASTLSAADVAAFDQFLGTGMAAVEADWAALARTAPTSATPANPAAINGAVNLMVGQTDALSGTLNQVQAAYEATGPSQANIGLMLRLDAEVAAVSPTVPGFRVDMTVLNDQVAAGPNLVAQLANLKLTAANAAGLAGEMAATLKDEGDFAAFEQLINASTLPAATKAQFLAGFLKGMGTVDLDLMGVATADHSNDTTAAGVQLGGSVVTSEAATLLFADQATLANALNSAESAYLKAGGTATAAIKQWNADGSVLAADLTALAAKYRAATSSALSAAGTALMTTINAEKAAVLVDLGAGSALAGDLAAFGQVLAGSGLASRTEISLGIATAAANLTADATASTSASTSLKQATAPNAMRVALNRVTLDKSALDFWLATAEAELKGVKFSAGPPLALAKLEAAMAAITADIAALQANLAKIPSLVTA